MKLYKAALVAGAVVLGGSLASRIGYNITHPGLAGAYRMYEFNRSLNDTARKAHEMIFSQSLDQTVSLTEHAPPMADAGRLSLHAHQAKQYWDAGDPQKARQELDIIIKDTHNAKRRIEAEFGKPQLNTEEGFNVAHILGAGILVAGAYLYLRRSLADKYLPRGSSKRRCTCYPQVNIPQTPVDEITDGTKRQIPVARRVIKE